MTGLEINSTLFPYRLSLKEKSPMELTIELKNSEAKTKNISFDLVLPDIVALDKSGFNKGVQKRIDGFKSHDRQKFVFELHPTKKIDVGEYEGLVIVEEYSGNYDYIVGSYKRPVLIRVVP